MAHAIEVQQASKRYGRVQALDRVDLNIAQGEFFGLLGPNGAGKTTLISLLAGLARADSGSLKVMGHDVTRDYRRARRALGVVPQELVFDPFFSVRETLRLQSGYFGLRHNEAWVDEIIQRLDLEDKADSNMRSLSGGMKRRVLVGQALVHRPPVIILDEPTAGVDVELRQGLWKFIRELNSAGHTIVLTTHCSSRGASLRSIQLAICFSTSRARACVCAWNPTSYRRLSNTTAQGQRTGAGSCSCLTVPVWRKYSPACANHTYTSRNWK
jgi:ABC-2 type transport system ATP-binding protein